MALFSNRGGDSHATKTILRATGVFLMLALLGCASQDSFRHVVPEYRDKNQFMANVLVLQMTDRLMDQKELRDLLRKYKIILERVSESELTYFNSYMGPSLSETTTAKITGIDPSFRPEGLEFDYRKLVGGDNQELWMILPKKGQVVYNNTIPDYVLFFEEYFVNTGYKEESGSGLGKGTESMYSLSARLEYCLWDNMLEKVASFGKLEDYVHLMSLPKKQHYIQLFDKFALSIIEESPLVRKY